MSRLEITKILVIAGRGERTEDGRSIEKTGCSGQNRDQYHRAQTLMASEATMPRCVVVFSENSRP